MKITRKQLKRIIREEKISLQEGRMGEYWYECMDALFEMALDNSYVACCCASKVLDKAGMDSHDAETSIQLIADCIDDGMLAPMPHPEYAQVTVYMAID